MATQPEIDEVRLNIGDTSLTPVLSDVIITAKIDKYVQPPHTSAQAVYFATLDCLIALKAGSIAASAASKVKIGDVEIENSTGADNSYRLYCDLYDFWLGNPPSGVGTRAMFKFGGVSASETKRVNDDSDSVGAGIKQGWLDDDGNYYNENSFREL